MCKDIVAVCIKHKYTCLPMNALGLILSIDDHYVIAVKNWLFDPCKLSRHNWQQFGVPVMALLVK